MNAQEYVTFALANPVCFLASGDGDQPHVRTVLLWKADSTGFYFILLSPKRVSAQLKKNAKAEVCFYNHAADLAQAKQMRVTGTMKLIKDPIMQAQAVTDRAFVGQFIGRPVDDLIEVFHLTAAKAHFWMLRDNLREPQLAEATF